MKTEKKPPTKEFVQAIGELTGARQRLAAQARQQYAFEVDDVLRGALQSIQLSAVGTATI